MDDEVEESEFDPFEAARITYVDACDEWSQFQDNLANEMWAEYIVTHPSLGNFVIGSFTYNKSWFDTNSWFDSNLVELMPQKSQEPKGKGRVVENPGTKHVWTPAKDSALLQLLLAMFVDPKWKCDNGTYRPGYLVELETRMKEKIPSYDVKGHPHIASRVKLWKRQYVELCEIQDDKGSGLVRLDDIAEDAGVGLVEDGEGGTHYYEAPETTMEQEDEVGESTQPLPTQAQATRTQTQHSQSSMIYSSGGRRQRRRRSFTDQLGDGGEADSSVTNIETMLEGASQRIGQLANCFQFLADQHQARLMVFPEIQKLEGLTIEQQLKAGNILSNDLGKLQYFMTLLYDYKRALHCNAFILVSFRVVGINT
ncbi:amino acid permease 2-like protein [Corchorus olitorius]|uniref:Amino acid permease 2-like protein n=1 Tax=Corchorus olitorius TaxID=93759 RepID=A0A1R3IVX4_9ROSI|nr:amino acid permease 2-like protein [Corchorus olitorius]